MSHIPADFRLSPLILIIKISIELSTAADNVMSGTIRWYRSKREPAKKGRVIQPTAAPITNLDAKAPDTLTNVWAYENAVAKVFAKIHIRNHICKKLV